MSIRESWGFRLFNIFKVTFMVLSIYISYPLISIKAINNMFMCIHLFDVYCQFVLETVLTVLNVPLDEFKSKVILIFRGYLYPFGA